MRLQIDSKTCQYPGQPSWLWYVAAPDALKIDSTGFAWCARGKVPGNFRRVHERISKFLPDVKPALQRTYPQDA